MIKFVLGFALVMLLLEACSVVELVVENHSRSISEAKRDPDCQGNVSKQTAKEDDSNKIELEIGNDK
jgi:hypothetical protein